ncbi:MAG: ferredoxin [Patescibacteria group bacterium]|mgnify:FL=1
MAKIIFNRNGCIGCGSCEAICPKYWEMDREEMKVNLKSAAKNNNGDYELKIFDIECNKKAEDCCPVRVIKVEE